jgi:DNA-binding GntR family transcriptional regulator
MRDQVHERILQSIVKGDIAPGARIRDAEIADRLSVSRTPVRESLLRLEHEGLVTNDLGRGFTVRPLTVEEVDEVYPILGLLESLALRSSGAVEESVLADLDSLNAWIANSDSDPVRRIEIDVVWHRKLVSACANHRLIELLNRFGAVVRRYEYFFKRETPLDRDAVEDHYKMVRLIRRGDTAKAADIVETHWQRSMVAMSEILKR